MDTQLADEWVERSWQRLGFDGADESTWDGSFFRLVSTHPVATLPFSHSPWPLFFCQKHLPKCSSFG